MGTHEVNAISSHNINRTIYIMVIYMSAGGVYIIHVHEESKIETVRLLFTTKKASFCPHFPVSGRKIPPLFCRLRLHSQNTFLRTRCAFRLRAGQGSLIVGTASAIPSRRWVDILNIYLFLYIYSICEVISLRVAKGCIL